MSLARTSRSDGSYGWLDNIPSIVVGSEEGNRLDYLVDEINKIYGKRGARMGLTVLEWIDPVHEYYITSDGPNDSSSGSPVVRSLGSGDAI